MMVRWILGVIGVVLALGAIVYGVGASLRRDHVASVERVIPQPIEQVAARIRDVSAYPQWRNVEVEDVAESDGAITYVEIADGDRIAYRRTEPEQGRVFISVITDDTLPFGGQWTFTLTTEGVNTRVRIEERGEVRDPLYRFFSRFVFGQTASMEQYLERLAASFV
jgi:hypothetical protein